MLVQSLREWCEVSSSSQKVAALLVVLGLVWVLMYEMIIGPRMNHLGALQREEQQLDQALMTQKRYERQRQQLTTEVFGLRKRYQALSEGLGMPLAVTEVLPGISSAANQAGVSFMRWKPEPVSSAHVQDIYGTATRLEVEGNYQGLARFLHALSRLPKALEVKAFSISALPHDQVHTTIQVTLDLVGYESSEFGP